MKQTGKVIFVIIGTIIGAGFASGKEIYLFFGKYGINGILGIMLSSIILGIIIYKTLIIAKNYNISTYKELINIMTDNNLMKQVIKLLINIFLLISFFIMIAGFSAYFSQEFGLSTLLGSALITFLCYITFLGNIERLIKANTLLIPILILFIFILAIKESSLSQSELHITNSNLLLSISKSILYSSYNSILLIPIVLTLYQYVKSKKQTFYIAGFTSLIISLLGIAIFSILLKINININDLELPAVYAANLVGKPYRIIYGFIILVSIYTSAISAGYGVLEEYINTKYYSKIAFIMCTLAIAISHIGFSSLVNYLYPVFGIIGLIQIFYLFKILRNFKKK